MIFEVKLNKDTLLWEIHGDNGDRGFEGNPVAVIRGTKQMAELLLPLYYELYAAQYFYGDPETGRPSSNRKLTEEGIYLHRTVLRYEFVGTEIKYQHQNSEGVWVEALFEKGELVKQINS
jgi:hypothetical protein